MNDRTAGLILAAGRSTRFGADKLAAKLRGRPLLQWVLDEATRAALSPLVAVVAAHDRALEWRDARPVLNPDPGRGLSSSLQVGLAELARFRRVERAVVLLGDQPLVSAAVIGRLLAEPVDPGQHIVVPLYAGRQPGNPVVVDRPAWHLASEIAGDRGLNQLFDRRPELVRYVEVEGANPDVDTPEELAALEVAPDGSPVLLYRRLPAGEEPALIDSAIPPRSQVLELGAGAGRITHRLVEFGHRVVAVDEAAPMLAAISGAEAVQSSIEGLDVGRKFDVVVLGSHLVNTSHDGQRQAFLETCRRHVADDGVVLIERHPADWADNATEGSVEREGVVIRLSDLERRPPFVSAVMTYIVDGIEFRQPFRARVLDDAALVDELARAGLSLDRHLGPRWVVARPVPLRGAASQPRFSRVVEPARSCRTEGAGRSRP